jgi:hypothetical protein
MNTFYVYEWFINDTLEVFYVGKGKGKRRFVKGRNRFFNNVIKKYNCSVRLVECHLTEQQAFELEQDRIAELRAIGQAKCNITDGGEGSSGLVHSEESKKKIGQNGDRELKAYWKGKKLSDETKKKMSEKRKGENHPMFGKEGAWKGKVGPNKGRVLSEETRRKMSEAAKNRKKK